MDKIHLTGDYLSGKVENDKLIGATIELTPLELVEQISHRDMGEILKLINLPHPETCICGKPAVNQFTLANPFPHCVNCLKPISKPIKPQEQFEPIEELELSVISDYHARIAINLLIINQRKIINTLKKEKA